MIISYVLVIALFFFWSHGFNNIEFINDMGKGTLFLYFNILSMYIIFMDRYIRDQTFEARQRFYMFLVFALNAIMSRVFSIVHTAGNQDLFFTIIASFPYMIYLIYFMRELLTRIINTDQDVVTEIEEGFVINKFYFAVIFLFSGLLGYVTHLMLNKLFGNS